MSRTPNRTKGSTPAPCPLRHLHPQDHRGGPGAGVQLARRPAGERARRSSPARRTRAGSACPTATTTAASPAATWTARPWPGSWPTSQAGKVDCVVVYKVDRLTRSLLDFARIMETFDQHKVSFVSVTQQFNTTHSMGRLTLNVLLSFAQFEREIIGERTRDKIAAQRRKGKWTGGVPLLGYDVDRSGPSPSWWSTPRRPRGSARSSPCTWSTGRCCRWCRSWTAGAGRPSAGSRGAGRGGGGPRPFDKCNLYGLLTNPCTSGRSGTRTSIRRASTRRSSTPGSSRRSRPC